MPAVTEMSEEQIAEWAAFYAAEDEFRAELDAQTAEFGDDPQPDFDDEPLEFDDDDWTREG